MSSRSPLFPLLAAASRSSPRRVCRPSFSQSAADAGKEQAAGTKEAGNSRPGSPRRSWSSARRRPTSRLDRHQPGLDRDRTAQAARPLRGRQVRARRHGHGREQGRIHAQAQGVRQQADRSSRRRRPGHRSLLWVVRPEDRRRRQRRHRPGHGGAVVGPLRPNTMGGIVNVITRRPAPEPRLSLRRLLRRQEHEGPGGRFFLSVGEVGFTVTASYQDSNGYGIQRPRRRRAVARQQRLQPDEQPQPEALLLPPTPPPRSW